MRWRKFWKKNKSYVNSQIIVENSQLDEKLPVNKQGGATEDAILWSKKSSCLCWKIQAAQKSRKPSENDQGEATGENIWESQLLMLENAIYSKK